VVRIAGSGHSRANTRGQHEQCLAVSIPPATPNAPERNAAAANVATGGDASFIVIPFNPFGLIVRAR